MTKTKEELEKELKGLCLNKIDIEYQIEYIKRDLSDFEKDLIRIDEKIKETMIELETAKPEATNKTKLEKIEGSIDEPMDKVRITLDELSEVLYGTKDNVFNRPERLKLEEALCYLGEAIANLERAQDRINGVLYTLNGENKDV